ALPPPLFQMNRLWLRQMCHACTDQMTGFIFQGYLLFKIILYCIKRKSRKEFTIRQFFQTVFIAGYACKFFHIAVPRGYILITDRPIYCKTIACRPFKIEIAPPLRMTGP